jgi:hypothetical protein
MPRIVTAAVSNRLNPSIGGAELLFQVIAKRYERGSIIIAIDSNRFHSCLMTFGSGCFVGYGAP